MGVRLRMRTGAGAGSDAALQAPHRRGGPARLVAAALAALGPLLGLAACTSAPSVGDGSVGGDWAVLPTPSVPVPPEGACTAADGPQTAGLTLAFLPGTAVDCTKPHLSETFSVGTFPAQADTDSSTVPTVGTARFRYAYGECVRQAKTFLGRDPHTSALVVLPVMPSERQWAGQARWFRCEVVEIAGLDRTVVVRSESLRHALTGAGPLATTCADVQLNATHDQVLAVTFTPCGQEHDAELVGAYTLPDGDYPSAARIQSLTSTGCPPVGAAYVGIPATDLIRPGSEVYTFASGLTKDQWSAGERTTSCFFGSSAKRRTGSIKGVRAFPY
ncbi:MAG TPA: septum formation family protein [Micromonosporaceae bacterium]|jgi:hypothetical protein